MKWVFADTHYWLALAKPGDQWADSAKRAKSALGPVILVTTDEVLSEFLAGMSKGGAQIRRIAVKMVRTIMANANMRVVAQSRDTFLKALDRYEAREDKAYSLADCASMNTMEAKEITEVLTNDHHFEQEGFTILMRE